VSEVLGRPLFKKAKIIAGKEGIFRPIRWVHVLQVAHVEALLSGNEMILSTGVGLRKGGEIVFIKKLIDLGVSCLCIELGHFFENIPKEMISIANQYQFPLIIFEERVRFIDL
ncbi:PucR family transcriptional regulator, partial [Butyricicoccus sp. 1XD8-22]